jgi:hypothetical protein
VAQIETAFAEAVIPVLTDLRDAFERAKPRVREIANKAFEETVWLVDRPILFALCRHLAVARTITGAGRGEYESENLWKENNCPQ